MNKLDLKVNWGTIRKYVVWATVIVLAYALYQYEKVNFDTTYESLVGLFGDGRWVRILAEAVVITDLAALARIFTAQSDKDEPMIVKVLLGIWVGVTMLDTGLTYFFAAVAMENTVVVAPKAVRPFLDIFPVLIAALVWGIQGGLLYLFGKLMESAIHGNKGDKAVAAQRTTNVHVTQTNHPKASPANMRTGAQKSRGAEAAAARWNGSGITKTPTKQEPQYTEINIADLARGMGVGRGDNGNEAF